MYISASIATAFLLTPALGSLYARDTYESLYARDLDARDAYYDAIYAREAAPRVHGSGGVHAGQVLQAAPGILNGGASVLQAVQGFQNLRRSAYPKGFHHESTHAAHPAQHAVGAHPASHPAAKHGGIGHALSGVLGHVDQVANGMNTASNLVGSGESLIQSVQGVASSFGNGASSNGANGAQQVQQRRSIYADPEIYERDFDDLYERDFDDLYERDLEDLYERDLEGLDERDLEGLDERDLDDLYERDIYDLYTRGFEAGLEDMYE
ncbi:hypothetical protein MMC18_003201 [Xylographa bjoerkii]|nr:hypothetical protein [Xylographa bjoerkii]